MKKQEFIGYLKALHDLAQDETFDDFDDGVEYVLERIIKKAEELELEYGITYPTYPVYPPGQTWCGESNVKIPDSPDWGITVTDNTKPQNFTVVK